MLARFQFANGEICYKENDKSLSCAKSLQILDVEKITQPPLILLPNILHIPKKQIGFIVHHYQQLFEKYKLVMEFVMVFLPQK